MFLYVSYKNGKIKFHLVIHYIENNKIGIFRKSKICKQSYITIYYTGITYMIFLTFPF